MDRTKDYLKHTGVCDHVHHKEQYIPQKELAGEWWVAGAWGQHHQEGTAAAGAAGGCCAAAATATLLLAPPPHTHPHPHYPLLPSPSCLPALPRPAPQP